MPERDTNGQDLDEPNTNQPNTDGQGTTRRFFSPAERFVLQAAAGGRCEECGAALGDDFHADHRLPYSAGGPTDLGNAAALCPQCNRRKGARIQGAQVPQAQVPQARIENTREMGPGTPAPTDDGAS